MALRPTASRTAAPVVWSPPRARREGRQHRVAGQQAQAGALGGVQRAVAVAGRAARRAEQRQLAARARPAPLQRNEL
jgi:hypothetical protein